MTTNTTDGAALLPVMQAIDAKLDAERKEREARAEQWAFIRSQLGWVPEDQVSVERNELQLDDYQSSIGNHSYLEQIHLWEMQPGEGEELRRAILTLPELLRFQMRDMMTDDERVAVGWTDIPHAEAIAAWNARISHPLPGGEQAEALSEMSRLRSEITKLHLECGSCSKWYTAQCPYETRLSGGKEGPSIEAEAASCRQFDLSDSIVGVIRRKEERIAEIQHAARAPLPATQEDAERSGVDELRRLLDNVGGFLDDFARADLDEGAADAVTVGMVYQQQAQTVVLPRIRGALAALPTPQRQEYGGEELARLVKNFLAAHDLSAADPASAELESRELDAISDLRYVLAHPAQATPSAVSGEAGEGWKPIETAHKDGRNILVIGLPPLWKGYPFVVFWDAHAENGEGWWRHTDPSLDSLYAVSDSITHWAEYPDPAALPSHKGAGE